MTDFDRVPHVTVTSLHQIEITSRCNLRCVYCVHPKMPRAKADMTEEVFLRCLHWVKHFASAGAQAELNLAGIGESTLHPDFVRWVFLAKEAISHHPQGKLVLATNGLLVTDELAQAIAPTGIEVTVSLHRPEKAAAAVNALRKAGIFYGVSTDPVTAATDWAGQVNWKPRVRVDRECQWIRTGNVFAMSDGRIQACCLDGKGDEPIGHVDDDMTTMFTRPYSLCPSCDQRIMIDGWDQKRARRTAKRGEFRL